MKPNLHKPFKVKAMDACSCALFDFLWSFKRTVSQDLSFDDMYDIYG